jgi:hypothetical protein
MTARILAKGLRSEIHQVFTAPGGKKSCEYQLNAEIAASTETRPNLL